MRVDTSGNVGIGTTNTFPGTLMNVRQGVTVRVDAAGSNPYFQLYNANAGSNLKTWRFGTDSAGALAIETVNDAYSAASERMRIDSSGNVGIGTSSPGSYGKLVSLGGDNATTFAAAGATNMLRVQGYNSTYVGTVLEAVNLAQSANTPMFVNASEIKFGIFGIERARIDGSGNFLVGTTDTTLFNNTSGTGLCYRAGASFDVLSASDNAVILNRAGTDGGIAEFRKAGTVVGSISVTTTATAYNTSSDYRLKENVQQMTGALAKVVALKPCTYKWKADGSDGEGFIAHELAEICPGAVTGEKDGEEMQGVDYGKITPLLTAALQEAIAEIKLLKARVAELEEK